MTRASYYLNGWQNDLSKTGRRAGVNVLSINEEMIRRKWLEGVPEQEEKKAAMPIVIQEHTQGDRQGEKTETGIKHQDYSQSHDNKGKKSSDSAK